MVKVETTVLIEKPIEDVFVYVTDTDNYTLWQGATLEVKRTSPGPLGLGSTSTQVSKFLGRRIEVEGVVIEFDPPNKSAVKVTSGSFPAEASFIFEPAAGGATRFTYLAEYDMGGFYKLAEPIISRAVNRQAKADLETLKDILEAQA